MKDKLISKLLKNLSCFEKVLLKIIFYSFSIKKNHYGTNYNTKKIIVFLTIFLQQNYKKNLKDKLISKLFKILSCFEMVLLKIIFYIKKITMVLIITKKKL
jgi:hypothetical protein